MTIVFGLAKYKNAVAGLRIQSVTYGETASSAEAVDEDGNIEQTDVHSKKKTIQIEANIVEGADLSAITVGGELTAAGDVYKIDNVSSQIGDNASAEEILQASLKILSV